VNIIEEIEKIKHEYILELNKERNPDYRYIQAKVADDAALMSSTFLKLFDLLQSYYKEQAESPKPEDDIITLNSIYRGFDDTGE
jgi:hypothetical protein